jgi:hypothetical protein
MMTDFSAYQSRKTATEAAYNNYCYAGAKLENARIHERLAELKSQHDPLNKMIGLPVSDPNYLAMREKLYAAAFYVVVGREE